MFFVGGRVSAAYCVHAIREVCFLCVVVWYVSVVVHVRLVGMPAVCDCFLRFGTSCFAKVSGKERCFLVPSAPVLAGPAPSRGCETCKDSAFAGSIIAVHGLPARPGHMEPFAQKT